MTQRGGDIISKLADRGEEVIGRISDLPGAKNLVEALTSMRERIDDLQKRMRGLDTLEQRVDDLEKRLGDVERKTSGGSRRAPAPKTASRPKASTGGERASTRTKPSTPPESTPPSAEPQQPI